jgi:valyl-tRNA synthetase
LSEVVTEATKAFEDYNYARALEQTESFFWFFTDDYVELVKERAYRDPADDAARSAHATLATALSVLHRLFAPVLPFVTEEVWSWWQSGSVHASNWPTVEDLAESSQDGNPALLDAVTAVLTDVRKAKSDAKTSMRTHVVRAAVQGPAEQVRLLQTAKSDLAAAGRIATLEISDGSSELAVQVELAEA